MRQTYGPYVSTGLFTKTGHEITEGELAQWVAEAERGYDVHRPPFGIMREDIVESESVPGTYYHLKLKADGTWSCDCPGFTYRQDCKHVRRKMEEEQHGH